MFRKIIPLLIFIICITSLKSQPNSTINADSNSFPIAVWLQSTFNAPKYKDAGINLYVGLWDSLDSLQLSDLHSVNMKVMCSQTNFGLININDTIIYGWTQMDEPDNAQWNDSTQTYDPCIPPAQIIAQYDSINAKDSSRPVYLNLGQGVAWNEYYGRGACSGNIDTYKLSKDGYIKGCDIVSFDIYPINSSDTATQDKLWLVAKGIDSLKSWGENTRPAWCWIECTQISNTSPRKPTPAEVKAEVWMALIHGAKGFGYFCHSWYPSFNEWALLSDTVMLAAVKAINEQVTSLAPVLNSSNKYLAADVTSSNNAVPIDIMTKHYEGNTYIFAVSMRKGSTTGTFSYGSIDSVKVIGENRTIKALNGEFSDDFPDYSVHLYKLYSTPNSVKETNDIDGNRIYPNPASDFIYLPALYNEVKIYNFMGQEVMSLNPCNTRRIDVSGLTPGLYFVRLTVQNSVKYDRIIKE